MASGSPRCRFAPTCAAVVAILAATCLIASVGVAAESGITLDGLRTPTSPVFTLMGIESASVERASSPKKFALDVVSAVYQEDGLPKTYAFQFAPYWTQSQPSVGFEEYMRPSVLQSALQTLSLSVVFSQTAPATETELAKTEAGFGFRTQLISGRPTAKTTRTLNTALIPAMYASLVVDDTEDTDIPNADDLRQATDEFAQELIDDPDKLQLDGLTDDERATMAKNAKQWLAEYLATKTASTPDEVQEIRDDLRKTIQEPTLAFQDANQHRVGFVVELAGAASVHTPREDFGEFEVKKFGLWFTPSYRLDSRPFEFLAVVRAIRDRTQNATLVDYGARVLWHVDKFGLSFEFLQRYNGSVTPSTTTERGALILEYELDDTRYLTATYGKDFDTGPDGSPNTLVLLGLNFGIGPDSLVPPVATK